MSYLAEVWRVIYALIVIFLASVTLGVILGIVLVVGLAIGWAFNLLMDALFYGTPYTQIDEDDET